VGTLEVSQGLKDRALVDYRDHEWLCLRYRGAWFLKLTNDPMAIRHPGFYLRDIDARRLLRTGQMKIKQDEHRTDQTG
jgi:hypothetical protein